MNSYKDYYRNKIPQLPQPASPGGMMAKPMPDLRFATGRWPMGRNNQDVFDIGQGRPLGGTVNGHSYGDDALTPGSAQRFNRPVSAAPAAPASVPGLQPFRQNFQGGYSPVLGNASAAPNTMGGGSGGSQINPYQTILQMLGSPMGGGNYGFPGSAALRLPPGADPKRISDPYYRQMISAAGPSPGPDYELVSEPGQGFNGHLNPVLTWRKKIPMTTR